MDLLKETESLYSLLPEVACQECGQCCVSPTCTFAEFIYLMHHCTSKLPRKDLEDFIYATPRTSAVHEGNLVCVFLENKLCKVHLWRTGACRLFGIPSLENLGVSDLVSCFNNIRIVSGRADEEFVNDWLNRITRLNEGLYAFGKEPYYVYGLNLECWLDVCLDGSITADLFSEMRTIMAQYFDLSSFADRYRPKTGLKEKTDKISILSMLLDTGEKQVIRDALVSIRDDYPLTGTYYLKEAEKMIEVLGTQT